MQIVKTLVITKLMFLHLFLLSQKNIIKQVDSSIYDFIWKGKDNIKRLALISDYKNGGLRVPYIQTMIDTQGITFLSKYA